MSDLSRRAIQAVDPAGMLDDVLAQHAQLDDALWRVDSAGIERRDLAGGLVVAGMGGSAVGGDLAAAAIGDRAERPLRTVRAYVLDRYVGQDTLVRRLALPARRASSSQPEARSPSRPAPTACRWSACPRGCSRGPRWRT
ncbi:MAG: hypothetical protein E6G22_07710 [Actinobacteria bacterium]|nr:MAG: hypothetical protein E6G22_07710 [Actinomycetota bacterium]